jgi:chromosome partitioning protein
MSTKPHIIVIGNEKGGTGKSTICMHMIVSLLQGGYKVGSIDVDARQGSLSRYIQNRTTFATAHPDKNIPLPTHIPIFKSDLDSVEQSYSKEHDDFTAALDTLKDMDVVVIDTPGTDSNLSRIAHSFADTLITPLNDSLVDFDVLGRVDGENVRPSLYAEMVWDQKKHRAIRDGGSIDWIIIRNRLSSLNARNKAQVEKLVAQLAKRIGVRSVDGLGERVIFRELFLQGLTLMDLRELNITPTLSHLAARQEVRALMESIKLPLVDGLQKSA